MEYSPTLCFAGFNSKGENSSRKEKQKGQMQHFVVIEFCVSQQTFKQMARELCHDNLSSVVTQRAEY